MDDKTNYHEAMLLHIQAYTPLFYVGATSPEAVTEELLAFAVEHDMSATVISAADANTHEMDPIRVLDLILRTEIKNKHVKRTLFILQFYHLFLKDPDPLILAKLRRIADAKIPFTTTIIIGAPNFKMPVELADVCQIEASLSPAKIEKVLLTGGIKTTPQEFTLLTQALSGCVSQAEVETLLALAIVKTNKNSTKTTARAIIDERKSLLRPKNKKAFEVIDPAFGLENIGGMEELQHWIKLRVPLLWNQSLQALKLPPPRGLLLIGPPGCGKSFFALAVGKEFKIPVLKLNAALLFHSHLGESEAALYQALETMCRFNTPLVFLIDEIEKVFSLRNGELDGNTTYRLLSIFLDFLCNHQKQIFTIATCNSIFHLPPELLRKGRFDELFYIPFPDVWERKAIISAICKKHEITITDTNRLVEELEGFTGSEIEQVIRDALYEFVANKSLQKIIPELSLIRLARKTVPLKVTMEESVHALEEWARTKCRWASRQK